MIRAFLGIGLPPEVRSRIAVLQFLLPLPRRVEAEDFHLTLCFLGEVPERVLVALDEALQGLRQVPFDLALRGVGMFGGAAPRAVWAGVEPSEPLARLQTKVERMARMAGASPSAQKFVPHVTLGRFSPPAPDAAIRLERAVAGEALFRAGPFGVDEVVLWRSHAAPRGVARYEVLAAYPLDPREVSGGWH